MGSRIAIPSGQPLASSNSGVLPWRSVASPAATCKEWIANPDWLLDDDGAVDEREAWDFQLLNPNCLRGPKWRCNSLHYIDLKVAFLYLRYSFGIARRGPTWRSRWD